MLICCNCHIAAWPTCSSFNTCFHYNIYLLNYMGTKNYLNTRVTMFVQLGINLKHKENLRLPNSLWVIRLLLLFYDYIYDALLFLWFLSIVPKTKHPFKEQLFLSRYWDNYTDEANHEIKLYSTLFLIIHINYTWQHPIVCLCSC